MRTVRVATYNVRRCEGVDGRVDPARTAAVLNATGADVLALQELDQRVPRSGLADQPRLLEENLGKPVLFHPTIDLGGGRYGIALAAEGLEEPGSRVLPGRSEPRAALWATKSGVTFVCTHLSLEDGDRALQTAALADLCGDLPAPVVLLGDLNQTRRGLGPLLRAGLRPGPGRHLTHSSKWPRHQIDWVLGGPGARVVRSWTLASRASDHRPLVAEVEV